MPPTSQTKSALTVTLQASFSLVGKISKQVAAWGYGRSKRYVTLRTIAVCVCEALVAGVVAVVYSIADVRLVDALAARQALERPVVRRTASTRMVVHAAAPATASRTHRGCPEAQRGDNVSPSVVCYGRRAFSAAGFVSVDTYTPGD